MLLATYFLWHTITELLVWSQGSELSNRRVISQCSSLHQKPLELFS